MKEVAKVPIEKLDKKTLKLVKLAAKVRKRAYAPYSRFLVGSCILDERGKLHTGCNFENACFNAGICSERTAIGKLVSRGGKRIKKIAIVTSSNEPIFPCGLCLQAISEFGKDAEVIAVNKQLSVFATLPLSELYPYSFDAAELP